MINTQRMSVGRMIRSIVVPIVVAISLVFITVLSASASEIGTDRLNDRVSRYFVREATPSFSAFITSPAIKLPDVQVEPVLAAIKAAEEEAARVAAAEAARQAAAQAASRAATTVVAPSGAISGAPCGRGSAIEAGLTANAITVYRAVCANFPGISSYGGNRGTPDEHGWGLALDIMVSGDAGWAVANYLMANAGALSVNYVIYSQQINMGSGWRGMEDRGSITQNHYDHVHVTVY